MPFATRSECSLELAQVLDSSPLQNIRGSAGLPLAAAASAGQFGFVVGGWGTGGSVLEGEAASGNTKTSNASLIFFLPQNYEAATDITLKIKARTSVVLATASTLDVQAYKSDENGGVGSDLCTTAAQSINSATWAEISFTITGTTLNPGDMLEVYIQCVADDSTGANAGKSQIGNINFVSSTRM